MSRAWIWVQLIIGWLPVWALYMIIIYTSHPEVRAGAAALSALRAVAVAAVLGLAVHWLTRRVRWPHPFRLWFVLLHAFVATAWAFLWVFFTTFLTGAMQGQLVLGIPAVSGYLVLGVWIYVSVAGTSYATRATARAARAEAVATAARLAALRAQLNPHFLFNALHTVVQLIPRDPDAAARAAERIAALLRRALEEEREQVPLEDEWAFVTRYLEIERERFGERLVIDAELSPDVLEVSLPTFALQTLVENAVRHGAAPRATPTIIRIRAVGGRHVLTLTVEDEGEAANGTGGAGTGLSRLRDRLAVLYGARARLETGPNDRGGFRAILEIPR